MRGRQRKSRICTDGENEMKGRTQILPLGGKEVGAHCILVGAVLCRSGDID